MKARRITDVQAFGRVALLYGGWAAEREVSLVSGQAVLAALQNLGVDVLPMDANRDNVMRLRKQGINRVFNIVHGAGGEDGLIQAALELQGLPYTGSGVLASALSMDKLRSKQLWQALDIPSAAFTSLHADTDWDAVAAELGLPIFVKPATEGSSIGMSKVSRAADLQAAWQLAVRYCPRVLAERSIETRQGGGEYSVSIVAGEVLPFVRIIPDGEYYDYHAKYESEVTAYHCPSGLSAALEANIGALALKAFQALDGQGWGRVDFMLDADDQPWFLEINTVPGMTSHSLVPMAAKQAGLSFDELIWRILETTMPAGQEGT